MLRSTVMSHSDAPQVVGKHLVTCRRISFCLKRILLLLLLLLLSLSLSLSLSAMWLLQYADNGVYRHQNLVDDTTRGMSFSLWG